MPGKTYRQIYTHYFDKLRKHKSFEEYISYGLKFYIKDFEDQILLKDRIMTELFNVADEKGLTIPYPIAEIKILENQNPISHKSKTI